MASDSSQTMPRSGSAKLWNSSMTTAETLAEVERRRVQQAVEQDLGDDDEDAGVGVDAAVAGDEADVVGAEAPADGARPASRWNFCSVRAISGVV